MTNNKEQKRRIPFVICYSLFVILSAASCAARLPPRPTGTPTPDPSAADAFITATAACKGFRSIEGELSLSGRAGGERVRGRILTGLESGGLVRLEAVAPFGAPFFILAGSRDRATLVLPREHRVLKDTAVADVLGRITGLSLGADDLRLIVSGCLVDKASPADGRQWGGGWRAVTLGPERVAYLRVQNGQPGTDRRRLRSVARRLLRARQRLPAPGPRPPRPWRRRRRLRDRHHRAHRAARREHPDQSAGVGR